MVTVSAATLPSAVALTATSVPAVIAVPPVKVLAPVTVRVPVPVLEISPAPLILPPSVMLPVFVLKVRTPDAILKGLLIVSKAVLLLVTLPVRLKELPTFALVVPSPMTKALAPELKVIPATLNEEDVRLLFKLTPPAPAAPKTRESPLMGGVLPPVPAVQFVEVFQVFDAPVHVSAPLVARTGVASAATARNAPTTRVSVEMNLDLLDFMAVKSRI
jgi:hypothetical protein